MERKIALNDLRPCDACSGNLQKPFHIIEIRLAMLKPDAVNETIGLAQMMGMGRPGNASAALQIAEVMGPHGDDVVAVMQEGDEVWICYDCFMNGFDLTHAIGNRAAEIERLERERTASASGGK